MSDVKNHESSTSSDDRYEVDEALLIGRPTEKEVASAISELTGAEVAVSLGYSFLSFESFSLKFALPEYPAQECEISVYVDVLPDDVDTPYRGLISRVFASRNSASINDVTFSIMEKVAGVFGGWTRRPVMVRNKQYGGKMMATPETAYWNYHAKPDTHDPALDAEIEITKHMHSSSAPVLYDIMRNSEKLNALIDILTTYRDATKDGVDRLPAPASVSAKMRFLR